MKTWYQKDQSAHEQEILTFVELLKNAKEKVENSLHCVIESAFKII